MRRMLIVAMSGLISWQPMGCGTSSSGFLTLADLTDFPEGTAKGDEFDGWTYEFVSSVTRSCVCALDEFPSGYCTIIGQGPMVGEIIRVRQDGGFVSVEIINLEEIGGEGGVSTAAGTLNADGTYVQGFVGRVFDAITNETTGQGFILVEGQIGDLLLTEHLTERVIVESNGFRADCQLEVDIISGRVQLPVAAGTDAVGDGTPGSPG